MWGFLSELGKGPQKHPHSKEEALYAGVQVVSFCKPMDIDFEHHHIVMTIEEMKNKVEDLIKDKQSIVKRVLTFPIEEVCERISSLYI